MNFAYLKLVLIIIAVCVLSLFGYKYLNQKNKELQNLNNQLQLVIKNNQDLDLKLKKAFKEKEDEIKIINSKHANIIRSLSNRPSRSEPTLKDDSVNCSRAGSTGKQLSREDAEFLIGEATKAMILRESLASCRRYLLEN